MKQIKQLVPFPSLISCLRSSFFLISYFLFLISISCKTTKISEVTKAGNSIVIKLLHVNDVYEIAPLGGGKIGGLARVAHISDSIKNKYPNTYLVMAGDFLNPSLLGTLTFNGERIKGGQMIEAMNAAGFDLATFGNHEFDLSETELQARLNESNFQWTSANVFQKKGDDLHTFYTIKNNDSISIPETVTYDIDIDEEYPVRLGFFSVTLDSNPQDYVYYSDFMLEGKSAYTSLQQQGADIIIGLTHLEVEQDIALAQSLPDLDLVMGGHEHTNMLVPAGNTVIAKADANAKTMYIHTLTFNYKNETLARDSQLVVIDDKVPSQAATSGVVKKWDAILQAEITKVIDQPNKVIYTTKTPWDGTDSAGRSKQTNLGAIITAAMSQSFDTPVDAAIVNGGSFRVDDMLVGDITPIDIFRILPFGGAVKKVQIKGSLLSKVLDYGKQARGTGAYLHYHHITESEQGWLLQNKPIDQTTIYSIAMSDFLLKGYDIPFLTTENEGVMEVYTPTQNEPACDIRKAVISYLKEL